MRTATQGIPDRVAASTSHVVSPPNAYRYSMIDTLDQSLVHDFVFRSPKAYIIQWVSPGRYVTGLDSGPDSIYTVDPKRLTVRAVSRVSPHPNQVGYENHATAVYAADLLFGDGS